jgi:hypothetical protein
MTAFGRFLPFTLGRKHRPKAVADMRLQSQGRFTYPRKAHQIQENSDDGDTFVRHHIAYVCSR